MVISVENDEASSAVRAPTTFLEIRDCASGASPAQDDHVALDRPGEFMVDATRPAPQNFAVARPLYVEDKGIRFPSVAISPRVALGARRLPSSEM